MTTAKLEKYVKKYLRLKDAPAKLQDALAADGNLDAQEQLDVFQAIRDKKTPAPRAPHPDPDHRAAEAEDAKPKRLDPERANNTLNLTGFDYHAEKGFRGKEFDKYLDLVNGPMDEDNGNQRDVRLSGLKPLQQYVFELYDVQPIYVKKYPDLKDSPTVLVGIKINLVKPLNVTKIFPHQARLLNEQIGNAQARDRGGSTGARTGYARYYLLKKD